MEIDDITKIALLVEIDGHAHQVLATPENKMLMLKMLAKLEGQLRLTHEIEPVTFVTKIK